MGSETTRIGDVEYRDTGGNDRLEIAAFAAA